MFFAGAQNSGREFGVIRRIGEVLCLQTESFSASIQISALSRTMRLKKVAAVELDSGLRRQYFHFHSGDWLEYSSCARK